jgi:Ca2+-dependent lipid-binding protein
MLNIALPDPYAIVMVDETQTQQTAVFKKFLNPNWNESFDLWVHTLMYNARSLLTFGQSCGEHERHYRLDI